ncbi:IPT/TIG domain-containing protein [Deinococcus arenicola]|uniref:IPT/TIG domain-containing protein n=1 Tax=Deinococcus arenicola TaxID=2994950 RepID=A0ABU4DNL4_9DEIO|nr:IPT/TIG domain-containing protein [Deinococcus sp. ZS9-10]MDV6374034.1 IPT/TIG domain-containing protein [Deinococcus sp. ZS9-10]
MLRFLVASSLLIGTLASCAPTTSADQFVTVKPVLIKVSEPAIRGGSLTIQGRYLGGSIGGRVRLGATETGEGGYVFPASAVQTWTDSEIVLTIPDDAPLGGSWLFVDVGGKQSTGLPYSVRQ